MAKREKYDWSQTPDEDLRRMFVDENLSGSDIAERLGHGLTHSAVMGRLSRRGIKKGESKPAKQPSPSRPIRLSLNRKISKDSLQTTADQPDGIAPISNSVDLINAMEAVENGRCRAPLGNPSRPGFAYCNTTATEGSFCAIHARLYYRMPAPHRRSRAKGSTDATR